MPLRCSGRQHTFVPLRRCWVICWRLRRAAVARVSATLGPWGLLAMWHWVWPRTVVAVPGSWHAPVAKFASCAWARRLGRGPHGCVDKMMVGVARVPGC